ncbi:UNKNOWN [Stylonychia lemnae]|uniref:Uncharacterized protein n=1 Tax=Stylonychia lemnae TaxID=5949 RepID=A0A078A343_STYLE|nr:UNKNOWN [Stylonychia lemnae]|eukprot:CDW76582.1 UNKNOWN [Stylonychia lemnae]
MIQDRGIIYKTNGTGRDTYIFNDNGGFSLQYQPNSYDKPGTFLPNVLKRQNEKSPVIHSRAVNYRHDGSGRDSYIITGNGGYQNSGKHSEFREAFKQSLRSYERNDFYLQKRKSSNFKPNSTHMLSLKNILSQNNIIIEDIKNENKQYENIHLESPQMKDTLKSNTQMILQKNLSMPRNVNKEMSMTQTYFKNQGLYTQSFNQSRNSLAAATIVQDNPKQSQINRLATYQKTLNLRLSQPRIKSDDSFVASPEKSKENFKIQEEMSKKNLKLKKINIEERQELYKKYLEKVQNSRQGSPVDGISQKISDTQVNLLNNLN